MNTKHLLLSLLAILSLCPTLLAGAPSDVRTSGLKGQRPFRENAVLQRGIGSPETIHDKVPAVTPETILEGRHFELSCDAKTELLFQSGNRVILMCNPGGEDWEAWQGTYLQENDVVHLKFCDWVLDNYFHVIGEGILEVANLGYIYLNDGLETPATEACRFIETDDPGFFDEFQSFVSWRRKESLYNFQLSTLIPMLEQLKLSNQLQYQRFQEKYLQSIDGIPRYGLKLTCGSGSQEGLLEGVEELELPDPESLDESLAMIEQDLIQVKELLSPNQSKGSSVNVKQLTIKGDKVNVRSSPSVVGDNKLFQLMNGQVCEVLEKGTSEEIGGKRDYWYKISANGKSGWVFGAFTSLAL